MSVENMDSSTFRTTSSARIASSDSEDSQDEPPRVEDDNAPLSSDYDDEGFSDHSTGEVTAGNGKQLGISEIAEVWQLKRAFAGMEEEFEQKMSVVDISRSDLKHCRQRLESVQQQKMRLEEKLAMALGDSNRPAADLTRAQLLKVTDNIDREVELEKTLREALKEAELVLLKAEMEMSSYMYAMQSVEEDEEQIGTTKSELNSQRVTKEKELMDSYLAHKRALEKKQRDDIVQDEEQRKKSLLEAKKAHDLTVALMQKSLLKKKQQRENQEEESKQQLERRITAVLSLKQNIDANRESLQKAQAVREVQAKAFKERDEEMDTLELTKQRKLDEFSKKLESFECLKHAREVEIVDNLLKEEERLRKMKDRLNEPHWRPRDIAVQPQGQAKKSKSKTRRATKPAVSQLIHPEYPEIMITVEPPSVEVQHVGSSAGRVESRTLSELDERPESLEVGSEGEGEELLEPVFAGLWKERTGATGRAVSFSAYHEEERDDHCAGHKHVMSKMEQDIHLQHLETQRKRITQKQVVAGIEFKGPAFRSNPEIIEFKGFQPGKEYKRTVQLTNISYTVNTCKMIGLSEELKDFITIQFTPPGPISAGIACSMIVKFEPQIERDLYGEIEMLAQTGPFSIPIRCLKKRCVVSVGETIVNFDKVCIGESVARKIVLSNSGALGTDFQLSKLPVVVDQPQDHLQQGDELKGSVVSIAIEPFTGQDVNQSPNEQPVQGHLGGTNSRSTDANSSKASTGNGDSIAGKDTSTPNKPAKEDGETVGPPSVSATVSWRDSPQENTVTEDTVQPASPHSFPSEPVTSTVVEFSPELTEDVHMMSELDSLAPHSEAVLEVTFTPTRVGTLKAFFSIGFSDQEVDSINLQIEGSCVDVPVSVEHEITDFHICEVGRLYQTPLNFSNSSSRSIPLSFHIPKSHQPFLDVLPEMLTLPPHASVPAQIKFSPSPSLCANSSEEPFQVDILGKVPNQTLPVQFSIAAILTKPEVEFAQSKLDFGFCGTQESVTAVLGVTNLSLLPQGIGFVGLPKIVDVQPCDGFLTLLPRETFNIDIIVSPTKPGPFAFNLSCMTAGGRKYSIACRGTAVQSPLHLDANTVCFPGTPLYCHSTESVWLSCEKSKESGKKDGPHRSFEFCLPKDSPFTIFPATGVIQEGKKLRIDVQFHPRLNKESISSETDRMIAEAEEEARAAKEAARIKKEEEAQKETMSNQKKPRKTTAVGKGKQRKGSGVETVEPVNDSPQPAKMHRSQYMFAAQQLLLTRYTPQESHIRVPCFATSGSPASETNSKYRPEEAVFLDVHFRSTQPSLIMASQHGQSKVDFGTVVAGERVVKEIYIKNISDRSIGPSTPLLDPSGPFELLNALRKIEPGRTLCIALSFSPKEAENFLEPVDLFYSEGQYLRLTLVGVGVASDVDLEGVAEGVVNFGHTLTGDTITESIKLKNNTFVPVTYNVCLDSSHKESSKGVSNWNGSGVFQFCPAHGQIPSGTCVDFTITFQPDHPSLLYSNRASVKINSKEKVFQFEVKGQAWKNTMYVLDSEAKQNLPESLVMQNEDKDSLVVTFVTCLRDESLSILSKQIVIGAVKSTMVKKNGGEYSFDAIQGSNPKSFAIEPMKGLVEGDGHKTVTLSFNPPKTEQHSTLDAVTMMTLKGEPNQQQVKIILRGIIVD